MHRSSTCCVFLLQTSCACCRVWPVAGLSDLILDPITAWLDFSLCRCIPGQQALTCLLVDASNRSAAEFKLWWDGKEKDWRLCLCGYDGYGSAARSIMETNNRLDIIVQLCTSAPFLNAHSTKRDVHLLSTVAAFQRLFILHVCLSTLLLSVCVFQCWARVLSMQPPPEGVTPSTRGSLSVWWLWATVWRTVPARTRTPMRSTPSAGTVSSGTLYSRVWDTHICQIEHMNTPNRAVHLV